MANLPSAGTLSVNISPVQLRGFSLPINIQTIAEETGANNLYLALGMLNWRLDNRELRSPLVLVPVTISTANRGEHYVLTIDEACARYDISIEELATWRRLVERAGMQGLRVTKVQHYRDLHERQMRY